MAKILLVSLLLVFAYSYRKRHQRFLRDRSFAKQTAMDDVLAQAPL